MTVTSIISGPGDRVRLPPTTCRVWRAASAAKPATMASKSARGSAGGSAIESSASLGAAPIAARSLRLTASARWPIASGGTNARSKWIPSTSASTVRTSIRLRSGSTTAASSPMPTSSQAGAAGRRPRIRAISSRSEQSATRVGPGTATLLGVVDGAGFANHRHLDLARVFELVLDPPRDVLRQPDGFLVGDLLALDHDPDLAARLQRERLRDALERVGDPFELFQALDVGLEDVAARPRTCRRDRVGRLHDHRLERRPVDVHVVRGHRHHHCFALAVLTEEVDADLQVRAFYLA